MYFLRKLSFISREVILEFVREGRVLAPPSEPCRPPCARAAQMLKCHAGRQVSTNPEPTLKILYEELLEKN